MTTSPRIIFTGSSRAWPAAAWGLTWLALYGLDGHWSLGNLALVLVLGSTVSSLWQSPTTSALACASAVAAFDWFFVSPRFTFEVQLHEDLLLLAALLCTSMLTSVLTSRLRRQSQVESHRALQAMRQQELTYRLQHATQVSEQVQTVQALLRDWTGLDVRVWIRSEPAGDLPGELVHALEASLREPGAMGPGTGRFEDLNTLVIPLRAGVQRLGAISAGPLPAGLEVKPDLVDDLMKIGSTAGDEIQRLQSATEMRVSQERLQTQQLRTTLLAAISHDYRTPLATIAGAASGLLEGTDAARTRLTAQVILDEVQHLNRMTGNTLQLARLDPLVAPPNCSWESLQELAGSALSGVRRHHALRVIDVDLPNDLPLLWCDPVLVVQLLDNLLENALLYSPPEASVMLRAAHREGVVQLEVLDRGPGIPEEARERVFDPFVRLVSSRPGNASTTTDGRPGMGIGLALCRAIARVHEASIGIEGREGGGSVVRVRFPRRTQPDFDSQEPTT